MDRQRRLKRVKSQMNSKRINQLLSFLKEIEKLKHVERRVFLSGDDRPESAAEHAWHMAMFVMLFEKEFPKLNVEKMLKMALIHDLVEIYAGDTFAYDGEGKKTQNEREMKAAKKLFKRLPKDIEKEFWRLFLDFDERRTPEGRVANSFDKLQPIIQVIICKGGAWRKNKIKLEDIDGYKRQFMIHDKKVMSIYDKILSEVKKVI